MANLAEFPARAIENSYRGEVSGLRKFIDATWRVTIGAGASRGFVNGLPNRASQHQEEKQEKHTGNSLKHTA
jgi:hypothetical protein